MAGLEAGPYGMVLDVEVRETPALAGLAASWAGAEVRVGVHWLDADGAEVEWDGPRGDPIDLRWLGLAPARRRIRVGGPPPGAVRARIDLVAEGVAWGSLVGLETAELALPEGLDLPDAEGPGRGPAAPEEDPAATREWLSVGLARGRAAGRDGELRRRRPGAVPDERAAGARPGPDPRDRRQPLLHHPPAGRPVPGRRADPHQLLRRRRGRAGAAGGRRLRRRGGALPLRPGGHRGGAAALPGRVVRHRPALRGDRAPGGGPGARPAGDPPGAGPRAAACC